jgi:hypothetical protein
LFFDEFPQFLFVLFGVVVVAAAVSAAAFALAPIKLEIELTHLSQSSPSFIPNKKFKHANPHNLLPLLKPGVPLTNKPKIPLKQHFS